jgi:Secreted repeat of unknown function
VTLNGTPVYRYAEDRRNGEATGQGIESFGGTWHALAASGHIVASKPTMNPMPPPMTAPGYGY